MDLLQYGAQILSDKLGLNVDANTIQSALSSLLGDGKGGLDLQGLVSQFTSGGGMESLVQSFLGDGSNLPMSADQVMGLLGESKVSDFAGKIGTDASSAAGGLADMLPQVLDKASSGGDLLASLGGSGGLLGAAKSFLG